MRYRMLADGSAATSPAQSTTDIVALTVWFTLICGVVLLGMGIYGRQRWLQFWGGLTLICVAVYYMRGVLGLTSV